jgi:tricorn protease
MWIRDTGLAWIMEDQSGNAGIFVSEGDAPPRQVTFLDGGDITFPSVSADGGTICFEYDGGLWITGPPSWEVREVRLESGAAEPFPLDVDIFTGTFTDGYDVLSDTGQIALVSDGEVFCGRIEDGSIGSVRRLTSTPGREWGPAWSPDGGSLAFSRETDGRVELVLAGPADPDSGFTVFHSPDPVVLPAGSSVAEKPEWSPDGTMISYLDADARLHVFEVTSYRDWTVCDVPGIIHHSWSPDGRWLAFSVPDLAHREDVFVVPSTGGEPANVSRHPNDDFQPVWTSDGRRLLYASRTDEGAYSIRQVWLSREDFGADTDRREELLDEPLAEVAIDFDGLQRRTETLCTVEGYYDFFGASPDGRTIAFRAYDPEGGSDLWSVDWKGEGLTRLTFSDEAPEDIRVLDDGSIFYLGMGGVLRSIPVGGMSQMLTWSSRVDWSIPLRQTQKFDECWRLLRDNFYDPGMHGVDWDAVRDRYRERASLCILNEDFNDVVNRMLGELSASHLGIYGPWSFGSSPMTGELGMIPDPTWDGPGVRVDSVIPWSPADLPGSRLIPGDLVLAIEGVPVGPEDDFYSPLAGRVGTETVLDVRRNGELIEIEITPVSTWELSDIAYEAWIERNRRIVSALTDDRIGYLHIQSMDQSSVEAFQRDLFAEGLGREGIIVDVRDNGGGSTHDQILRDLSRPRYLVSRNRDGRATLQPLGVWQQPAVLLINERCYSDAEIFPAGWKELGIGPVVGNATFGAVIGTNDVDLVDGTGFRIPSEGWFLLDGTNLENSGVQPDIRVLELPADFGLGKDRQLEEAARVALGLLEG